MKILFALLISASACFGQAFSPFDFFAGGMASTSTNTFSTNDVPYWPYGTYDTNITYFTNDDLNIVMDFRSTNFPPVFDTPFGWLTNSTLHTTGGKIDYWHNTAYNYKEGLHPYISWDTSVDSQYQPTLVDGEVQMMGSVLTNYAHITQPFSLVYVFKLPGITNDGGWLFYVGGSVSQYNLLAQIDNVGNVESPPNYILSLNFYNMDCGVYANVTPDVYHAAFVVVDGTNSWMRLDQGTILTNTNPDVYVDDNDFSPMIFGDSLGVSLTNSYKHVIGFHSAFSSNDTQVIYTNLQTMWGLP